MARSDWRSRLRDAVNSSGLTRAEIARRAGLNATALRDILDRGKTPSVDNLARIVRVLNLSLGKVYDGDIIGRIQLSISGSLAGGEMVAQFAPEFRPEVHLDISSEDLAFIRIDADDYSPTFRRGDLIGGVRTDGAYVGNLIRRECIVEDTAGRQYVGILMPGSKPGHFTVRSLVPGRDDITDITVAWAAPISLIMRQ